VRLEAASQTSEHGNQPLRIEQLTGAMHNVPVLYSRILNNRTARPGALAACIAALD
jgi:hypothetical protein